jgi:hypothetical protein
MTLEETNPYSVLCEYASFGEFPDEEGGLSEFHGRIVDIALAKVVAAKRLRA